MTVLTCDMINARFTNLIRSYINDGYEMCIISGPYRPTYAVDLSKRAHNNNELIRITHETDSVYNYTEHRYDYKFTITVKKYDKYNDFFETINKFVYCKLNDKLYTDADDFERIEKLKAERLKNKQYKVYNGIDACIPLNKVSTSFREKIMERIHSIRGMKSAKFNVVKLIHIHRYGDHLRCEIHWHTDDKHGILSLG